MAMTHDDWNSEIHAFLKAMIETDPRNELAAHNRERIYDVPLVGYAAASDPFFDLLKDPKASGPHHKSPLEWLPGARTVISYYLPFTEFVRKSNRGPGMPSEEWLSARIDGEVFNNAVRSSLATFIKERGYDAVVPSHTKQFSIVARRANWSERHAAFAAGLGSFGLNKALITKIGTAGRFGSVITDLELMPTPRSVTSVYAACPWFSHGQCGECIDRCPSKAITAEGKNVAVCAEYIDCQIRPRYNPRYGCAKCTTNVPCETRSPL